MEFQRKPRRENLFDDRLIVDGRQARFLRCRFFCERTGTILSFAIPKDLSTETLNFEPAMRSMSRSIFQIILTKRNDYDLRTCHFDPIILEELRWRDLAFSDLDFRVFPTPKFRKLAEGFYSEIDNYLKLNQTTSA